MTSSIQIDQVDDNILAFHETWERNRHVIEGARSVVPNASKYLPAMSNQNPEDYRAYVKRVPFYPGAARTAEGLKGLMFRRPATITAPENITDILDTITAQGFTIDDLAEEVAIELLATNFCALVVDYPAAPAGMSLKDSIDKGFRPFVALYKAESILGIETAVINNRQRVTRVRLLEDGKDKVRELRLDNGVYSIIIHRNIGGEWRADAPIVPRRGGKTLDEIPFTLVSTKRGFAPSKAPLDDVCDLNIQHYLASANLATCHYFSSAPIYITAGADMTDKEGNPLQYSMAPGSHWLFEKDTVKNEILEYTGATLSALRDAVKDVKDQMADVGSRILANDKAAAEAAETLAIRHASENATLASIARVISRKVTDACAWVAYWMGLAEDAISYELNTDYTAQAMSSQDITVRLSMLQSQAISSDTFIAMMVEGDILPENFDAELDRQKIAQALADAPTTSTDTSDL